MAAERAQSCDVVTNRTKGLHSFSIGRSAACCSCSGGNVKVSSNERSKHFKQLYSALRDSTELRLPPLSDYFGPLVNHCCWNTIDL